MSHKGVLGLQCFSSLSFIALGTAMNSTAAAIISKAGMASLQTEAFSFGVG
jgi:hypothetical protein